MDTGSVRSRIAISFPEVSKSSRVETGVSMGIASFEMKGVWDIIITCDERKKNITLVALHVMEFIVPISFSSIKLLKIVWLLLTYTECK